MDRLEVIKIYVNRMLVISSIMILIVACKDKEKKLLNNKNKIYDITIVIEPDEIYNIELTEKGSFYVVKNDTIENTFEDVKLLHDINLLFLNKKNSYYDFDQYDGMYLSIIKDSLGLKDSIKADRFQIYNNYSDLDNIDKKLTDIFIRMCDELNTTSIR